MNTRKKITQTITLLAGTLCFINCMVAQTDSTVHLKVLRMNDSYIDVYHNKPSGNKLPLLIFCQGSGYDSNTAGFLRITKNFEQQAVGLAIEKQGVAYGDKADSLADIYKLNNTIYNRLYDYLRVLQYLKVHASWWNGDVYVVVDRKAGYWRVCLHVITLM